MVARSSLEKTQMVAFRLGCSKEPGCTFYDLGFLSTKMRLQDCRDFTYANALDPVLAGRVSPIV